MAILNHDGTGDLMWLHFAEIRVGLHSIDI